MSDNSLKTSQLPTAGNVAPTDRVLILFNANNANTTPSTRTINFSNLCANITILNNTPANSSANGLAGNMSYDNNYLYICTSNNNWGRIQINSF
jgi:hypothetical protein